MHALLDELDSAVPLQGLLGYLNFSSGKPDPKFQKPWNDAHAWLAQRGHPAPVLTLRRLLNEKLQQLQNQGAPAFRDIEQAQGVLAAAFDAVLPAYKRHHADLLFHLSDDDFLQPFFLARILEATLSQRGPWIETERIVNGSLKQLNDYVGHRPIATLENRRRGDVYDHERFRPIPVYLRGVGSAFDVYQPLVAQAVELLEQAPKPMLLDAGLDVDLLDEIALDPRGYDFSHPVDKRTNYCYGEWDPHHLDSQGRYRRFVVRRIAVEGLWRRVLDADPADSRQRTERIFEAGSVLAGLILMSTGVAGWGPGALDSSVNLGNLIPKIARARDAFYQDLLKRQSGERAARLREEAKLTRQPFGAVRQHINRHYAQERARQNQRRAVALLLADIGYPQAARRQVADLTVASVRMLTELHVLLTTGDLLIERGELAPAAQLLPQIEDLLQRGIHCGAMPDPWNILGFQGQFPRFTALEDSVRDHRLEELIGVLDRLFTLYARVQAEAAAQKIPLGAEVSRPMNKLAVWWDQFATTTVSDLPHVQGSEAVASAEHVSQALTKWRERGATGADLGFWKEQLEGFRSPKAFALVIDALLGRQDFKASLGLLMTWLSHSDQVPLEEGDHSFHSLALRWLMGVCSWSGAGKDGQVASLEAIQMVRRFFDSMEVNADEYWQVPKLNPLGLKGDEDGPAEKEEEEPEELYGAAYEEMTYRDSTDDGVEGEVLDFMPAGADFDLSEEGPRIERRLQFHATLARLWNIATRIVRYTSPENRPISQEAMRGWLTQARHNFRQMLGLLDAVHDHDIPKPSGDYDSMVEFDRRRVIKESLLGAAITTCLEAHLAVGALRGVLDDVNDDAVETKAPPWEPLVLQLGRSLLVKDDAHVRAILIPFMDTFREEPLLYTPLAQGGHPRQILRASLAQRILQALVANLPRQGLLRETYLLLQMAQQIEHHQQMVGPRVTEFDRLFSLGVQSVVEAALDSAAADAIPPQRVVRALEELIEPFLTVWMDHSQTLRVAVLESLSSDADWERLKNFIQRYGKDLFTPRFLAMGNLRGILHRGVGAYLDSLKENAETSNRLLEEIGGKISRDEAERMMQLILQALLENYDHYKDYQATTTQSDYGENLYQLLDFLRLNARYERHAWQMKPLGIVHEVLARHHGPTASLWREQVQELSRGPADELIEDLASLEAQHGMRLTTVRDRLEERFIRPLAVDRLCALVAPAVESAKDHLGDDALIPLEEEMKPFIDHPTGVGLDQPVWITRLEEELERVRTARTALVSLAESLFQVPKMVVPFDRLTEGFDDLPKAEK